MSGQFLSMSKVHLDPYQDVASRIDEADAIWNRPVAVLHGATTRLRHIGEQAKGSTISSNSILSVEFNNTVEVSPEVFHSCPFGTLAYGNVVVI